MSPTLNLPDTQLKHFFPLSQWEIPLLPVTYVWHLLAGSSGTTLAHLSILKLSAPC